MKRLSLFVAISVAACGGDNLSDVRIDLAALHNHAAQTGQSFESVELLVTGAGVDLNPVVLDPATLTFDIEVPSGSARTFAVEAWNEFGDERGTVYWGAVTEDLTPGTTIDLTLPAGPAGRVFGAVTLIDGTALPAGVELTFSTTEPMPPLPDTVVVPVTDGMYSTPLPVGMWTVSTSVTVGGNTYSVPDGFHLFPYQGEAFQNDIELTSPTLVTDATVEVYDDAGAALAGITVLVHDATGAVKQTTATGDGTAGVFGQVVVSVEDGDMVTVLDDTDPMGYTASLYTVMGVTRGDVLRFEFYVSESQPNILGSINVGVASTPSLATSFSARAGSCWANPNIGMSSPLQIEDTCLSDTGTINVLGIATDGKFQFAGFATATDLPSSPSLPTSLTLDAWDEVPPTFDVTISNPPAATGSIDVYPEMRRGGQNYAPWSTQFPDFANLRPVTFPVPTDFADLIDVDMYAVDPTSGGNYGIFRRVLAGTLPGTISVDLGATMLPFISSVTVDSTAAPSRPSVAWTSSATPTQLDAVTVEFSWFESTSQHWYLLAPPAAVTTLQVPELPASLSAYDPAQQTMQPGVTVEHLDLSTTAGYSELLGTVGAAILSSDPGTYLPATDATAAFASLYGGK